MHEFGHASAACLSCNKVTGIEVYGSEGGLCHFSSSNMKCAQRIVAPESRALRTEHAVVAVLAHHAMHSSELWPEEPQ